MSKKLRDPQDNEIVEALRREVMRTISDVLPKTPLTGRVLIKVNNLFKGVLN